MAAVGLLVAVVVLGLGGTAAAEPPPRQQLPAPGPVSPELLDQATGGDGRLSIAVRDIEPFAMPDGDGWTGYSVELWEDAAEALGIPYDYVQVATVSEQLDAVRTGRTDAALGAISITAEREAEFDFSFPMYDSGLQILVRPESPGVWAQLLELFSTTVLYLLIVLVVLLVIVGHVVWLIERHTNDDFPHGYFAGVWEGIWWAIVTMTTIGYGDRTVQSKWGRLVAMIWMLVGLVLVAHFTAVITSVLTADRLRSEVRSVSDLYGRSVVTVAATTSSKYLQDVAVPATEVESVEEAFGRVASGEAEAMVYDSPVLRYLVEQQGRDDLQVVGPLIRPQGYGMAFSVGNPLVAPIDLEFLQLREDGTTADLDEQYFGGS